MVNWFNIINIQNILLLAVGFFVGRFWRLGKKIIKQIGNENGQQQN